MVIGTQASGALVLATAHQAQRRAYGASAAGTVPRRVVLVVLSTASGFFYRFKAGRWDFYRFSRSLPLVVLLPFYVKSAAAGLLHYPHPTTLSTLQSACALSRRPGGRVRD